MKDFFISYNKADREMATWIDRWLKEAGYSTHFQEADFLPGSNWAYEMLQGGEAARTIAVLSPDYLKANWTWPEMLSAFAADPKGKDRKLLFVRVGECELPQMLRQLAFNQLFKGLIHSPYEIGGNTNDVDRLVFTGEQLRAEAVAFARTLKERESLTIHPRNLAEDVKATALLRQVGTDHYAFAHLTLEVGCHG